MAPHEAWLDDNAPMQPGTQRPGRAMAGSLARERAAWGGATLLTLGLWALAAASVAFWVLHIAYQSTFAAPLSPPSSTTGPVAQNQDLEQAQATLALARHLGAVQGAGSPQQVLAPDATRYQLQGIALEGSHLGAALIAVGGQKAKPYALGSTVEGNVVVKAIEPRRVVLSSGAREFEMVLVQPAAPGDIAPVQSPGGENSKTRTSGAAAATGAAASPESAQRRVTPPYALQ